MTDLQSLPARSSKQAFHVVVESPGGSRVKIAYDQKLRAFKFSRPLVAGVCYPYDWGFIPGTVAPDGDPLDAMVFCDTPTFPGVVIECRALGVLRLKQNRKNAGGRERNDRLIAIPIETPRFNRFERQRTFRCAGARNSKIFFSRQRALKTKRPKSSGWGSAAQGERMIERCLCRSTECMAPQHKR